MRGSNSTAQKQESLPQWVFDFIVTCKARRIELGLSQSDVDRMTGLGFPTMNRFEHGKLPNPTVGTLARIAKALNLKIILLGLTDNRQSS